MAVVLDTNVLVAAGFNPRSISAKVVHAVEQGRGADGTRPSLAARCDCDGADMLQPSSTASRSKRYSHLSTPYQRPCILPRGADFPGLRFAPRQRPGQ